MKNKGITLVHPKMKMSSTDVFLLCNQWLPSTVWLTLLKISYINPIQVWSNLRVRKIWQNCIY